MNIYSERLLNEWIKYGKILISVDYDSTISYWPTINNKPDIERTISLLKQAFNIGAYIVIFTCSDVDRYEDIQKHCEELQLPINAINKNAIDLPYGNNGKIYYNINLCDRSGLVEACNILEEAMYAYIGWQNNKNLIDVA